jgi:hypothetical protein
MNTLKKAAVVGLVLGLLAAGTVGAQSDGAGTGDVDLERLVETYNANVDEAPDIARGQLAGQTIEIRVGDGEELAAKDTGTAFYVTTAESGRVTDYGDGDAESPTIRVRTSEATLDRILNAEEPGRAFDEAYSNGEIQINGLTLTESVKIEVVKFAVWLGKTFGLF